MLTTTNLLNNLRAKFAQHVNQFLTQQSITYREAAGAISQNDQLQQQIFEHLVAIIKSDSLEAAKQHATHALHASDQLDSSMHFLLHCRMQEQKAREAEIQHFTAEFNKTVEHLAAELTVLA